MPIRVLHCRSDEEEGNGGGAAKLGAWPFNLAGNNFNGPTRPWYNHRSAHLAHKVIKAHWAQMSVSYKPIDFLQWPAWRNTTAPPASLELWIGEKRGNPSSVKQNWGSVHELLITSSLINRQVINSISPINVSPRSRLGENSFNCWYQK